MHLSTHCTCHVPSETTSFVIHFPSVCLLLLPISSKMLGCIIVRCHLANICFTTCLAPIQIPRFVRILNIPKGFWISSKRIAPYKEQFSFGISWSWHDIDLSLTSQLSSMQKLLTLFPYIYYNLIWSIVHEHN